MDGKLKKARAEAQKRQVDDVARHFFICIGPDCVAPKEGERLWSHVKKRVGEAKEQSPEGRIYRTKVGCLRICEQGPVGVVYPEGTWYAGLDRDAIDRVVREHLLQGRVVEDLQIGQSKGH
jgi:(2Fe-2S) ferredoxin